jgi:hypothetical protein
VWRTSSAVKEGYGSACPIMATSCLNILKLRFSSLKSAIAIPFVSCLVRAPGIVTVDIYTRIQSSRAIQNAGCPHSPSPNDSSKPVSQELASGWLRRAKDNALATLPSANSKWNRGLFCAAGKADGGKTRTPRQANRHGDLDDESTIATRLQSDSCACPPNGTGDQPRRGMRLLRAEGTLEGRVADRSAAAASACWAEAPGPSWLSRIRVLHFPISPPPELTRVPLAESLGLLARPN